MRGFRSICGVLVTLAGLSGPLPAHAQTPEAPETVSESARSNDLGTTLQRDGYAMRPPSGFRMREMEWFQGSRAGAVAQLGHSRRELSAALSDGEGDSAATMLVSLIEEPFEVSPSAREDFSIAVVRHLSEELGLPFALDRSQSVTDGTPRVEVTGYVTEAGLKRHLLVAAYPGRARHGVVLFSVPSGRYTELLPHLQRSLESFHLTEVTPTPFWLSQRVLGAVAGGLGGALIVSSLVLRNRRRRLRMERGEG